MPQLFLLISRQPKGLTAINLVEGRRKIRTMILYICIFWLMEIYALNSFKIFHIAVKKEKKRQISVLSALQSAWIMGIMQLRKPGRLTFSRRNRVRPTGFEFVSTGFEFVLWKGTQILCVELDSCEKKVSLRGFRSSKQYFTAQK